MTATFLPVLASVELGLEPAVFPGLVDDGAFDGLDGHRVVVDVQRAGGFAGCRANPAGEFREIVGRMQVARGFFPVAVVNEIVPVGDLVVHRAARVTIGNAAVHAARRLALGCLFRQGNDELAVVADAIRRRLVLAVLPLDLEEARDLAHHNPFCAVPALAADFWFYHKAKK